MRCRGIETLLIHNSLLTANGAHEHDVNARALSDQSADLTSAGFPVMTLFYVAIFSVTL